MNEKLAPSEPRQHQAQALRAAEFLYFDAHQILKQDPAHEGAHYVQLLMEPIILGCAAGLPPQVVLDKLVSELSAQETARNKEVEGKSFYIATIGLDSVGKAGVTSYLREKYGFEAHPLSDRLVDIGLALGYEPPFDREKLREISLTIKGLLGKTILIRFAESLFARSDKPNRVVFDGIRIPEEVIELLSKELSSDVTTIIIAVETGMKDEEADLEERFFRSQKRSSDKDPKEYELFRKNSMKEAPGILAAMKLAHLTVQNERDKEDEMLAKIDNYMALQGVTMISTNS